jgi:hypothetical protein
MSNNCGGMFETPLSIFVGVVIWGNDFESYNVSCIIVFSIVSNRLRYAKLL